MDSSSEATTSSVLSRRPSSYDVFINFRGVDTRDNFAWLLYEALRRAGIHAFIDSEELWEGEKIRPSLERAIQGSKISIPVFSEHYADSKYCLLELAQIWESHLSDGQTILPIFVGVEPYHVRYHKGSFLEPLEKHKRRGEPVEVWKNALTEVADLKGWSLDVKGDANIKEQSSKAELVAQRVLRELGRTPFDEPIQLVGIEHHVNEVCRLLDIGSDDIRFVGICGMGGLGKTTMAKVVYNRIFKSFKGSSFLIDVRQEASQGNKGLAYLQNRLLQDIFERNYNISIVSRGLELIAERLQGENVLLILDDVDDPKQLDALAGGLNWFGKKSKVIITTRDMHILNVHEKKIGKEIQIYMPKELNFENSLHLFSLHAFSERKPLEKYKQLSHEVVCYAEGLPLTLEVLGSFLIDKNEEEWKDTLQRLKDILPGKSIKNYDDNVFAKLMISYEKLGALEKTIFLDVACYFSGWKEEEAISVWKVCEMYSSLAINELKRKNLLKIDAHGRLKMHDQLRFMGRRIVLEDSHGNPTKCSRMWSQDEILKVLKEYKGTQMVEGIVFDQKFEGAFSCEDFQKMPNLRFLRIMQNNLSGDFSHLPSRLRWFYWVGYHLEVVPENFYHEELVHIVLSGSSINLLWKDKPKNEKKRFQKLKVLNLSGCAKLSVSPNFSWFPCLQELDLTSCSSLLELSDSICQIASLKILSLAYCKSFKKLPTSIGDLEHLVKLSVRETIIEELPDGVGQLKELKELDASGCVELRRLPRSMGRMRSLHHFDLESTRILDLPDDFSDLSSLEVLCMSMPSRIPTLRYQRGYMMELPAPFSVTSFSLPQLRELYLERFISLESFPELPSTLTHLQVVEFDSLQIIPDLSRLERLKVLILDNCKALVKLPDLSNLKGLRELNIRKCENLEAIHGLKGTESLEDLTVLYCQKLRALSDLSKLRRLRKLNIKFCENLTDIQGLEGTESLEEFDARGCCNISEMTKKIHGQGRLLHSVGKGQGSRSIADDEINHGSAILCVVFAFPPWILERLKGNSLSVNFDIEAFVHWGVKKTTCRFSIRFERIQPTPGDIICIHHFNGFPLERKGAIEILNVWGEPIKRPCYFNVEVKFWKVVFENKESVQQMPNQQSSALLVADFFRWSHADVNNQRKVNQRNRRILESVPYDSSC